MGVNHNGPYLSHICEKANHYVALFKEPLQYTQCIETTRVGKTYLPCGCLDCRDLLMQIFLICGCQAKVFFACVTSLYSLNFCYLSPSEHINNPEELQKFLELQRTTEYRDKHVAPSLQRDRPFKLMRVPSGPLNPPLARLILQQ